MVRVPADMAEVEEAAAIERVVAKTVRRLRATRRADDPSLERRAQRLADRYLDGIRPTSVRWSDRMRFRYGSCSVGSGDIRISTDLAQHPDRVIDGVLVHELAHLVQPNHSAAFHALADRFPHQRWVDGYLAGFDAGRFARLVEPSDAAEDEVGSHVDGTDGGRPNAT